MRFGRRTAVLLVIAVSLAIPVPARADNFGTGPPNTGWLADSSLHTFCYSVALEPQYHDNANYAFYTSLDQATDMNVRDDTGSSNCLTTADVFVFDANLAPGTRGTYRCVYFVGGNPPVCDHSEVVVDPAEIFIGVNDEEDLTKSFCHEIGHSVGLTHGGNTDCMLNGEIPDAGVKWRSYDSHHKSHINTQY